MFCRNCGCENDDNNEYCVSCRCKLNKSNEPIKVVKKEVDDTSFSAKAIACFVISLVGIIQFAFPSILILTPFLSVLGAILGFRAIEEINYGEKVGKELSIVGIIISFLSMVFFLIMFLKWYWNIKRLDKN